MKTFGERLKAKLQQNNVNQRQFAEMLCVHESTVSGWMIGKALPREENMDAICSLLECDANWLLGNTRALNRNQSGAVDPTAYEAIKNIESEDRNMGQAKGSIWEVEDRGFEQRKVIIVSNNERENDIYLNAIFLTEEDRGKIVVPVGMGGVYMYADCTKVAVLKNDRILRKIGDATESEMADINAGIIEALDLPCTTDAIDHSAEVSELRDTIRILKSDNEELERRLVSACAAPPAPTEEIIRLTAERDIYKAQFENMLNMKISG